MEQLAPLMYGMQHSGSNYAMQLLLTNFQHIRNTQSLIDYNLFYRKWLDFSLENPQEVFMLPYEDLIDDLEGALDILAAKLKLERLLDQELMSTFKYQISL